MEPSRKDLEKMTTVGEVMDWCGIEGTESVDTMKGSLLLVLGATITTHPRFIGRLTATKYSSYFESWSIGATKPTAVQDGQADMFGHVCRLIAGTVESNASGSAVGKKVSSKVGMGGFSLKAPTRQTLLQWQLYLQQCALLSDRGRRILLSDWLIDSLVTNSAHLDFWVLQHFSSLLL